MKLNWKRMLAATALLALMISAAPAYAEESTEAMSAKTVYAGIDYSPVYDYDYYVARHEGLKEKYGSNTKKVLKHYVLYGYPKGEKGRKGAGKKDFAKVRKQRIAKYLKKTKTGALTDQIIVVCDHELSLWEKQDDGSWVRKLKSYCGYGRNGMSENRTQGDKTTPIGAFTIPFAFGSKKNPGALMEWRDITPASYWSGEYDTYNTWVESRYGMSGEHLADYYQYAYAMVIGFNMDPPVYGRGSAIFLHCKSTDHWYTSGCVSVKSKVMKQLLRCCRDGTYIIIVKKDKDIKKY